MLSSFHWVLGTFFYQHTSAFTLLHLHLLLFRTFFTALSACSTITSEKLISPVQTLSIPESSQCLLSPNCFHSPWTHISCSQLCTAYLTCPFMGLGMLRAVPQQNSWFQLAVWYPEHLSQCPQNDQEHQILPLFPKRPSYIQISIWIHCSVIWACK